MKQTLLIAALLLSVAACGKAAPVESKPDPAAQRIASLETPCLDPQAKKAGMVAWASGPGSYGAGYLAGKGDTAVILLHQVDDTMCNFKPFADYLASQDMRALAVDVSTPSRLDDAIAAAAYLRQLGAKKLFVVGASMGASLAIVVASKVTPPFDGVVSLSAPAVFQSLDARSAAKTLNMPIVFAAERASQFETAAQEMFASCPAKAKNIFLIGAGDHGIGLLDYGMKAVVRKFLSDPPAAESLSI